jgi:hypothetical protein
VAFEPELVFERVDDRFDPLADAADQRVGALRFVAFGRAQEQVWPSSDGSAVWVQEPVDRSRCALRQVGLDGRVIRPRRQFPCASGSDPPGGSLGLVVNRTRVIDPRTGRTVLRTPLDIFKTRLGIVAVAGEKLVLEDGPGKCFTLLDAATGAEQRLPWPSLLAGLDQPAVDLQGRFVALAFANPAGPHVRGRLSTCGCSTPRPGG